MMKSWMTRRIAVVFTALLIPTATVYADVCIQNGDFEILVPDGSAENWESSESGGLPDVAYFSYAGQGNVAHLFESFDLETHPDFAEPVSFAMLSQSFDVPIGVPIELSFQYRYPFDPLAETDLFWAFLDGDSDPFFTADTSMGPQVDDFRTFTHTFSSSQTQRTLTFQLTGEDDGFESYLEIDDVTCAVVPVPGAAVLGSLGLSYAGWRLRRRRN